MATQGSQEQTKSQRHPHSYCQEWKHQANNYNLFAEDLAQTLAGSTIANSVFVRPYEPWLVDSTGHALWVSSTPLTPKIPLPLLLQELWGKGLMEPSNLYCLSPPCLAVDLCIHSLSCAAKQSLSMDDWTRNPSMSIADPKTHLLIFFFFGKRAVMFGSTVGLQFLIIQSMWGMGSLPQIRLFIVGHSHEFWASIAPAYLAVRTDYRTKILWLG